MNNFIINTPKGKRRIGPGEPVFVIAEMSGNHNQDINRAYKIIDKAVEAGVDAVKIQTYTADTMTIDCDNDYFQVKVNDAWKGQTLYSLYKKAYTPWEWQTDLKKYAEKKGLLLFSTPFDNTAVDFLEGIGVELYKVASFEVVDIPLLKRIGKTKKPVIMSRGMASVEEIELAIKTLKESGTSQIVVLHCVSSYPAKPEQMNLATIADIVKRFNVISGLSDHTIENVVSVVSVTLGASVVEKHFTLSRSDGGPDAAFSLEPKEMKELVNSIRIAEKAVGVPKYGEKSENSIFRKSLFVVKDIKKGEKLTKENIRSIRPGFGLAPKYYKEVIGRQSIKNAKKGDPLKWDLIEKMSFKNYQIRLAKIDDSREVLKIRNHPLCRKCFNNQEIINFKNHDLWFKKMYFKNKNLCFVLENDNNEVIGYCRFDVYSEEDEYIVSIAVNPEYQTKGLGGYLLKESLNRYSKGKNILAEINSDNKASIKIFKNCGFTTYKINGSKHYLKYTS